MSKKPTSVDAFPPFALYHIFRDGWNGIMTVEKSPLRNLDPMVGHLVFQLLGYMWSAIFALAFANMFYFGVSAMAHTIVIGGLFITAAVHREAEKNPERLNKILSPKDNIINARAPGGEHE
tara:strand:+ start:2245 stop:2607 length:363 start_codon:yes stop_codon:yes gene_type:complete